MSDSRIKTAPETASVEDCLAMLKAVNARTYERLDKPHGGTRIGYIAQEVEGALPASGTFDNLVGRTQYAATEDDEPTQFLTVDYFKISVVLWACCQNLIKRVEALEAAAAP